MRKILLVPALIVLAGIAVIAASIARSSSATQNANSPTTTNRNENRSVTPPSGAGPQQDFSKNTWELPADADETKNPVQTTEESVAKGKELYLERTKGNCIFCHGETGSGNQENIAAGRLRRKPADLTNKERMTAMTDGELWWKVSKGITGIMPPGERRLSEEERWHVVNYIRTLAKDK